MLQSKNKKQKVQRHIHRCPSQRSVQFTCIVGERASVAVENEPPLLPGLDLSSHFDQVATAGLLRDGQVVARVCAVARRLNVSPQVKVVLSHRQVPGQRAGLEAQKSLSLGTGRLSDGRFSQHLIAQRTKFSLGGTALELSSPAPAVFRAVSPHARWASASGSSLPEAASPAPPFFFSPPRGPAFACPSPVPEQASENWVKAASLGVLPPTPPQLN